MKQHVIQNVIDWNIEAAEFAKEQSSERDFTRFSKNIMELQKLLK